MPLLPRPDVYDTYWYFAAERQNIFYRRLRGEPSPYTDDPILVSYKFCNAYRILDRVSQFLVRSVIYDAPRSEADTLFRIFLFRLLNRTQTWLDLEEKLGEISLRSFSPASYDQALRELSQQGPIYGNAFILCANKAFGFSRKHENHLALLDHVFNHSQAGRQLLAAGSLAQLFGRLRALPLLGDFMAYQLAIDFNYSPTFNFDESSFTVPGPGARRGIAKCFVDLGGLDPSTIIMSMVERQEEEFARLGLTFQPIGQRRLQAIDCQGLFCETDKYCRAKFPELASNRSRIKARFTPAPVPITYFFPPRWGVQLAS